MQKTAICKLCKLPRQLVGSHVFPKFVTRWIKATGSGYLRSVNQPNLRRQDGPIRHWLCSECEQLFGVNESYFASHIFEPVLGSTRFSFDHDARLMRFLVSLLWRVLHIDLEHARDGNSFVGEIFAAEEEWRYFLLGKGSLSRFGAVHFFVTDLTSECPPGAPHFNL